jgi:hypothetical protein
VRLHVPRPRLVLVVALAGLALAATVAERTRVAPETEPPCSSPPPAPPAGAACTDLAALPD